MEKRQRQRHTHEIAFPLTEQYLQTMKMEEVAHDKEKIKAAIKDLKRKMFAGLMYHKQYAHMNPDECFTLSYGNMRIAFFTLPETTSRFWDGQTDSRAEERESSYAMIISNDSGVIGHGMIEHWQKSDYVTLHYTIFDDEHLGYGKAALAVIMATCIQKPLFKEDSKPAKINRLVFMPERDATYVREFLRRAGFNGLQFALSQTENGAAPAAADTEALTETIPHAGSIPMEEMGELCRLADTSSRRA